MRTYEEQVKIEHAKLSIFHTAFIVLETIFFFLTLCVLPLIAILASWAGENFKMKLIGIAISFFYFFFTCGLAMLFQNMAFNNRDDFMIAGHTKDFDVIWKYKSEILAERKAKERGSFYHDGEGNFERK